ncbi:sensor domain-containing protein [Vibrio genomosp. F10]|uniref:cyclic-guanylate-specific phosphodiesterase n=1 Tax=Vibrio genomosp. F10 TaxID=723171 RepID=A0A1B9R2T7_9VIBR|nr:EAL domain-containing protein [Vibrio genomosp. F10]OCH78600.1 diguanylate cyclase [Vibrio genomosp. F10]OEF07079.1 diguanylate cyclase [Vibrio genomosp. F10 str. 9ZB36]
MFRIALPPLHLKQWQALIEQLSHKFQSKHQIYRYSAEREWRPLFDESGTPSFVLKTQTESPNFHLRRLDEMHSNAHYPDTESQIDFSGQQPYWISPIWYPNGTLFGFITSALTSSTTETESTNETESANKTESGHKTNSATQSDAFTSWLSMVSGKISFDLASLQYQHGKQLPSLQEFIDGLDDHVWIKNNRGEYVVCNSAVERAWGYASETIIGSKDHALFDEEIANKFVRADQHVVDNDSQYIVEECSSTDENNENIWLETIKSPVKDRQGELLGVLGMTRNVTRRKTVENQLKVTAKIFNNSYEGMMVTDHLGNLIEVNKAFSDITGYHPDEVRGRNPRLLKSGLQDAAFYKQMWQSLENTGQWKGELSNMRKDGTIYPQKSTITAVLDKNNQALNYLCVFEDITTRKAHEQKLRKMAFYDPLTDLPNRTHLIQLLAEHIKTDQPFATLFLDIDHFKHINDSLGHYTGDQVLIELADRLKASTLRSHHIARIGGDEFVIVIDDLNDPDYLISMISSALGLFSAPFYPNDSQPLHLSTSIGVSRYPQDGTDTDTLLKNADTAMYLAKKNGRNGYAFYSPELTDQSKSHVRFHSALHQAIKNDEFHLVYQPQFDLTTGRISGLEALLRWHNPALGTISPDQFIPIAEKTGLINELGTWVIETACKQGKQWLDNGYQFSKIAVNVSANQLQQPHFSNTLQAILESTQFPAHHLEVEITEGFLMRDLALATHDLNQLKALGVEVSLDDFGTGYSSLSYLKGLPIDKIKVDRSFINDIPGDEDSVAIVSAIIAMAKSLSLKVIAEGIENQQQQDQLLALGCTIGQGFHLRKPLNPNEPENQRDLVELFTRPADGLMS